MSGFEGGMFSTNSPTIASKFCYYGSQSKYQQELSDRDIPFSLDKNLGYGIKYRINPLASASLIPDLLLLSIHNWLIRCLYSLFALHPNKFLNSSLCRLYTKETSFAFCGNLIFSVPNELSLQAFHSFIKASRLPFYQRDYDLSHFTTSNNINIKKTVAQAQDHFQRTYFLSMSNVLCLKSSPSYLFFDIPTLNAQCLHYRAACPQSL